MASLSWGQLSFFLNLFSKFMLQYLWHLSRGVHFLFSFISTISSCYRTCGISLVGGHFLSSFISTISSCYSACGISLVGSTFSLPSSLLEYKFMLQYLWHLSRGGPLSLFLNHFYKLTLQYLELTYLSWRPTFSLPSFLL